MTNINCSSNCIYQKDGKCLYDNIYISSFNKNQNCLHYTQSNTSNNHNSQSNI